MFDLKISFKNNVLLYKSMTKITGLTKPVGYDIGEFLSWSCHMVSSYNTSQIKFIN